MANDLTEGKKVNIKCLQREMCIKKKRQRQLLHRTLEML